jgi:predicted phosphoribosyltransferase
MIFSDRFEAGQKLAQKILDDSSLSSEFSSLALAFSFNGGKVAKVVAEVLKMPLVNLENSSNLKDKVVFLIDDGSLSEKDLKKVLSKIRILEPKKIVVAMPVIAKDFLEKVKDLADQVFYLEALEIFFNVNQFYQK